MKKNGLNGKKRNEIILIISSVALVLIVGLIVNYLNINHIENTVGNAGKLLADNPSLSGMLGLLNEYCYPVHGTNSNCDTLCGTDICVPVEDNCDEIIENNQCLCCKNP
jgi:hypothetical protein